MIEKYKHVIWDWNGTLMNDVDLCVELINQLLVPRGLKTLTREDYRNIFTVPVRDYYIKVGFDFSKESFEYLGMLWIDGYEERKFECGLYDGITNILERINKLGIGQSILSAYAQPTLDLMVEHYDIKKYFTHVVGLDNIYAAGKIHLGIDLMKRLGNGKGETLIIGDMIHDFEVAQEIGADCILLASGHQSYERLVSTGAKVVESVEQIF